MRRKKMKIINMLRGEEKNLIFKKKMSGKCEKTFSHVTKNSSSRRS